ncbi:hypothetical protein [Streptomyces sp. NPDC048191]|uniref:hypothetical protein n=1 Tax=Streptomyces sp. NPDC048191 TaxID=3155484 RepID=UPI00340B26ED
MSAAADHPGAGGWAIGDLSGFDWAAHQREFDARAAQTESARSAVATDFELGLAGGLSEADETAEAGGPATGVTVVTERLLDQLGRPGQICRECHHTFRPGEEVTVGRDPATGSFTLRHRRRLLGCGEGGAPDPHTARLAADFHRGLDETNPPSRDMSPRRLAPGDELLTVYENPGGPPFRFRCWACDMTLRPGDLVIRCTCSPDRPGCLGAIHRDPERGNLCYDNWRAHNSTNPCVGGGSG